LEVPDVQALARALTLTVMLAALLAAGLPAAHAYPLDPTRHHPVATPQPPGGGGAALERVLARERSSVPTPAPAQVSSPPRAATPGGQGGWVLPALGALAVVLILTAGGAAMVANRRGTRRPRAAKPA
jgi:hypothetical protein